MQTVKALNIPNYGQPFRAQMPKKTTFLGITAQIDPNNANVKPRLVYLQDSQFPKTEEQTYILLRGQSDLEHPDVKNWQFVGLTYDQNRRHNGIATLWKVKPKIATPKLVDLNPKPKRERAPHSPESLAAIAAHEKKVRLEQERLKIDEVLDKHDKNSLIEALEEETFTHPPKFLGEKNKSQDLELKPLTSEAPSSEAPNAKNS